MHVPCFHKKKKSQSYLFLKTNPKPASLHSHAWLGLWSPWDHSPAGSVPAFKVQGGSAAAWETWLLGAAWDSIYSGRCALGEPVPTEAGAGDRLWFCL